MEKPNTVSAALTTSPPVILYPREHAFEVVWSVSRLCRGWVEVDLGGGAHPPGIKRFAYDGRGFIPQGERWLHVPVSGIPGGASCRVRTVTEAMEGDPQREVSAWRPLRLPSSRGESAHFALWNDTHQQDDTLCRLDAATPRDIDFLVWNGDLCASNWSDERLMLPALLRPGGTDFSRGRPLVFVPGNHDVRGKWGFRFAEMLPFPEGKSYQALRVGPVACLFLNTGEDKPDDHPTFQGRVAFDALRREQAQWMREAIRQPGFHDAPYRVVICHIPLRWTDEETDFGYDYFSKRSRDLWHAMLVEWGAQVILSGHRHEPTWLPPTAAFPYAQLVGGGAAEATARIIEVFAGQVQMKLRMSDVHGGNILEYSFPRLQEP